MANSVHNCRRDNLSYLTDASMVETNCPRRCRCSGAWPRSVSSRGHACALQTQRAAGIQLQSPDRCRIDTEGPRYIGLRFACSEPLLRFLPLLNLGGRPNRTPPFKGNCRAIRQFLAYLQSLACPCSQSTAGPLENWPMARRLFRRLRGW